AFGLVVGYRQDAQDETRREELRRLADALGFTFEEGSVDLRARFGEFRVFTEPSTTYGRNMMTGLVTGQPVTVADYGVISGGARSSKRSRPSQTIAVFPGDANGLPDFLLSPRRGGKVFDALARQ